MKVTCTKPGITFNAYHHTAISHYFVAEYWSGRRIEAHHEGEEWESAYLTFIQNVITYGG